MIDQAGFMLVATDVARGKELAPLHETVVLVAVHGDEGSLGFVLNRPSAVAAADALAEFGVAVPEHHDEMAFRGGRTRPDIGWLLFDPNGPTHYVEPEDSCLLTPDIGVTAAPSAMQEVYDASAPALLCLGHLTWDPEALDEEIEAGLWMKLPADRRLVFDAPPDRRWIDATCRALGLPRPWLGLVGLATA